jgi:hypothetical protein
MTKLLLVLPIALVAVLIACGGGNGGGDEDVTPGAAASPADQVQTPKLEPGVCQPNPDPATPEFQVIDQPSAGKSVTSPVTISGQVLAFEGTYQIGIFDNAGNPIVETFGTAAGTEIGELAPFSIDVAFDVDEPTPACIWVYEASAMDGSPIHVGQIPVALLP